MDQLKFYKYATSGLLLLNIVIIAFFFLTRPKHPRPQTAENFAEEVKDILHLSDQQNEAFTTMAREHNESMKSINERQEQLVLPYFERLTDASDTLTRDSVLSEIQQLERQKIEVTYRHLEDLKGILDEDQLPHFKVFMQRFTSRVLGRDKKSPPPPKEIN